MGIYPPIGYKRDPLDKHHFIIDEDSKRLRTSFGDVEVSVPRDRKGEFEPQVLKKNQTSISQDIEEKILSMYAKGMTTASEKSRLASVGRIFKFRGIKSPQTADTQDFQPMASILFAGFGGDGEIRILPENENTVKSS